MPKTCAWLFDGDSDRWQYGRAGVKDGFEIGMQYSMDEHPVYVENDDLSAIHVYKGKSVVKMNHFNRPITQFIFQVARLKFGSTEIREPHRSPVTEPITKMTVTTTILALLATRKPVVSNAHAQKSSTTLNMIFQDMTGTFSSMDEPKSILIPW